MKYELPVKYDQLHWAERKAVRLQYVEEQGGMCLYCHKPLDGPPCKSVSDKPIKWSLFPANFLKHPVHLQHCHESGMTEGAVHSYCNAVMWQYHGR